MNIIYTLAAGRCAMSVRREQRKTRKRRYKLHHASASLMYSVKLVVLSLSFSPLRHFIFILDATAGEGFVYCTFGVKLSAAEVFSQ